MVTNTEQEYQRQAYQKTATPPRKMAKGITHHTNAAVIGYALNGMDIKLICAYSGFPIHTVENILADHARDYKAWYGHELQSPIFQTLNLKK